MARFTRKLLATIAALQILAARQPVVEAAAPAPVELRDQLTEVQREWWDAWERDQLAVQGLLCGRRAGKSTLLAYWLVDGAAHGPAGSACVYISLTMKHAKRAMWRQLKAAASLTARPYTVLESEGAIHFHGAGSVVLGGCDKAIEIDKYRSLAILRAAVDECGKIKPDLLEYLDEDVLEPACMDHGGLRAYSGTPGSIPYGWWWHLTRPDATHGVPVKRWTAAENPHIKGGARVYWAGVLKRRGWSETHPKFVREYLGVWVVDVGELVFPLDMNLDGTPAPRRNTCATLPEKTPGGAWLDPSRWRYAIGLDLGYVHASAFSICAAHPGLAGKWFVVRTEKHIGWLTHQHRDRLRALKVEYPNASVVADTGGYGKPIVEELRRLWAQYVEAAAKTDKPGQIRIVRDDVLAGDMQVLDGEDNDALREEMGVMGWDPDDPTQPNPMAEDHAIDATLYARRRLHHYVQEDAPPPPTAEQAAEAERKRKFAQFAASNRAKKAARVAAGGLSR